MQYNNRPFFAQIIVKFIEQQRYYRMCTWNALYKELIVKLKFFLYLQKKYYFAETFYNYDLLL